MPLQRQHSFEHLTHPKYRADIDGLRAIAIVLVVLFHAFPTGGKGGFIGVDIFFVISGFLISTIIFQNLKSNSFSFIEFYQRRINRIFPAFIVILIASLLIGWFVLLADEYALLGKHVAAGSGFISNFVLWSESGYFDLNSEMKPLLHLWSLGVEEQYYIVWPLLLWFLYKRNINLIPAILILGLASFLLNVATVTNNPAEAFYSPLTRFWELVIGSSLAHLMLFNQPLLQKLGPFNANFRSILGSILMIAGVFFITKENAFPGWWALLPTMGTALVISAGSHAWLNRMVLSNRLLVWVGLISFPLYLWHWSLLSFARIMEMQLPSRDTRLSIIIISIVLAWLTYRFIEKPIRFGKKGNSMTVILIILMVLIGGFGYSSYKQNGFSFRTIYLLSGGKISADNISQGLTKESGNISLCRSTIAASAEFNENCLLHLLVDSKIKIVVWGDSHATSWLPVFKKIAENNNYELYVIGTQGCPSIEGVRRTDAAVYCKDVETTGNILDSIISLKPDLVFLTSWWSLYSHGLYIDGAPYKDHHYLTINPTKIATLETSRMALNTQIPTTLKLFEQNNIPVVVFKNPPVLNYSVANTRKSISEIQPTTLNHEKLSNFTNQIFNSIDNINLFDPAQKLCDEVCIAKSDGDWLYVDFTHLSPYGSMYFETEVDNLIKINLSK